MSSIISFPASLRPRLTPVRGNVDYIKLTERLVQIDALLHNSGLERCFLQKAIDQWQGKSQPAACQLQRFEQMAVQALRCNILRSLLQLPFRKFSCELAGSALFQWFCQIGALDVIVVPAKSQLQRFAHLLPASQMKQILHQLLQAAGQKPKELQLKAPLNLDEYYLDTTCLAAPIHFPVDWALLRDAVNSLMKSIKLIRKHKLNCRMPDPGDFLRQINRLSIQMSNQTRLTESKSKRKATLRQMKKLAKVVEKHAQRHACLLEDKWDQTDLTQGQAQQILRRIQNIVEQLPQAIHQAHERIIGGRQVENKDKILSLFEKQVRVIVRHKAGAEVEFGNTLLIGENAQGLILDCHLIEEQAAADSQLLSASLLRVEEGLNRTIKAVAADRGFASKANSQMLKEAGVFDAICPRQPDQLRERMKEKRFARMQRRRSQTEGRIGLSKANFLGPALRAKGFKNRELAVFWGVLTHNLWKLAKLIEGQKEKQIPPLSQAA